MRKTIEIGDYVELIDELSDGSIFRIVDVLKVIKNYKLEGHPCEYTEEQFKQVYRKGEWYEFTNCTDDSAWKEHQFGLYDIYNSGHLPWISYDREADEFNNWARIREIKKCRQCLNPMEKGVCTCVKKPEKIISKLEEAGDYKLGYNNAIDHMNLWLKEYLPNVKELKQIILESFVDETPFDDDNASDAAKVVHERIKI